MSVWHRKNLGDAMLAGDQLDLIKAQFIAAHESAGTPAEMALFIRHESEGRLHCEAVAYFPPAAAALARAVGATPCRRPAQESLGLLAGSESCWALLFPS